MASEDMAVDDDWVDVEMDTKQTWAHAGHTPQTKPVEAEWTFEVVQQDTASGFQVRDRNRTSHRIPAQDLNLLYRSIKDVGSIRTALQQPIFRINNKTKLEQTFLSDLDKDFQAEMNCSACKKFLKRYGALSVVNLETGNLIPIFWDRRKLKNNSTFHKSIESCIEIIETEQAFKEFRITEASREAGVEHAGGYKHMHFLFPSVSVQRDTVKGFSPADASELAKMLDHVLQDFDHKTVSAASQMILEDKLPHASQHKASIRWLRDIWDLNKISRAKNDCQRNNLLFHYAASSFVGCIKQLRSGALSTLLQSVKFDGNFEDIKRSWLEVTDPLKYMRPSAAPSKGQIDAAERLFESLGLTAEDMRRRYATSDDIPQSAFVYKAGTKLTNSKPGIFNQLLPENTEVDRTVPSDVASGVPNTSVSFVKFVEEIIPKARKIEYLVPHCATVYFFITGLPGSKPLMQWHSEENRVSWYTYPKGTILPALGLKRGWTEVRSIVAFPHLWGDMKLDNTPKVPRNSIEVESYTHRRHGINYLVQFQETRDSGNPGLCLFPTFLKSDLHGVKGTIEAYSKKGRIEPAMNIRGDSLEFFAGASLQSDSFSRIDNKTKHIFRVLDKEGRSGSYEILLFS